MAAKLLLSVITFLVTKNCRLSSLYIVNILYFVDIL